MAIIRKIRTKDIQTFGYFCKQFLDYISATRQGPDRLDLVLDSYVEDSITDLERNHSQDKASIEINYIHYGTPLLVEIDIFWSSSNTKLKLQMLLYIQAMNLCPEVEEADARIIPHAIHAVRGGIRRFVVFSGNTDVFVHLMHYWDVLHSEGLR